MQIVARHKHMYIIKNYLFIVIKENNLLMKTMHTHCNTIYIQHTIKVNTDTCIREVMCSLLLLLLRLAFSLSLPTLV